LRVVATRRLYDAGAAVAATPALHALVAPFSIHANPYDLDRIGVTTGDVVRVVTPRGSFESPVTVNEHVIRGTVEVPVNVATIGDAGAMIFDAAALVTEIRLESR
jgi:anaerobic selenocysteine-containing dehydrogenase